MHTPTENWTVEQLRAAVAAYADMAERLSLGESVVKQHVYNALAEEHGRVAQAWKQRFFNISYVLGTMGLSPAPGLFSMTRSHVGPTAEPIIRQAILDTPYFAAILLAGTTVEVPPAPLATPAVPVGNPNPATHTETVTRIERDPAVVSWVLEQADGYCENCGKEAPFLRPDDTPYLEVHHVKPLAAGGSDTVTNAVALCPNCHREFHYGSNATLLAAAIIGTVDRLMAE